MKFNPYNKPFAPLKPQKEITKFVEVGRIETYNYSNINKSELTNIPDYDQISVDVESDYDNSCTVKLIFLKMETGPNTSYGKELKKYKEQYEKYKTEIKEWKEQKIEWDKQEEEKKLKQKRVLFDRLKKELGK